LDSHFGIEVAGDTQFDRLVLADGKEQFFDIVHLDRENRLFFGPMGHVIITYHKFSILVLDDGHR
jgi:hypothetical protein